MKLFTTSQIAFFFLLFTITSYATNYTSIKDGDWSDPTTWSPNGVPNTSAYNGDNVTINHNVGHGGPTLQFTQGNGLTITSTGKLTVDGTFSIGYNTAVHVIEAGGVLDVTTFNYATNLANFTVNGKIGGTTFSMSSNASMSLTGALDFSGTITLNNGHIFTGGSASIDAETLNLTSSGSITGSNVDISVVETLNQSGNATINEKDFSINAKNYIRTDGTAIFAGGSITLSQNFEVLSSGTLFLKGTLVSVTNTIVVTGSAKISLENDGSLQTSSIALSGSAEILAQNGGGLLSFLFISMANGTCISTCSSPCAYNFNTPPPNFTHLCIGAPSLPIELTYFTASPKATSTDLQWETASETNNDFFSIEHSTDGKTWTVIAKMEGQGTTTIANQYDFQHNNPALQGDNYYRIKQTDFDGTFSYSSIQVVRFGSKNNSLAINVYPNPTTNYLKVEGINAIENTSIQLTDIYGKMMDINYDLDGNTININFNSELAPGYYILTLNDSGNTTSQKILVQ